MVQDEIVWLATWGVLGGKVDLLCPATKRLVFSDVVLLLKFCS
jgi:hypothetical protein